MSEYRLEMRDVVKAFPGVKALNHAQLKLKPGTVHALMGENGAGKPTLMKCLFGIYKMDAGEIYLDGQKIEVNNPDEAMKYGIAMVHQELNQCLERNVVDNLFLGRYPVNSLGMIDEGRMKKEASELFRKLGMTVNLEQPMKNNVSNAAVIPVTSQRCDIPKL